LWDAFRKPIDEAFNRKTEERERAAAALSARDRVVLEASKALEAANATGDAQKIKAAVTALEAALRGQAQAAAAVQAAGEAPADAPQAAPAQQPTEEAASAVSVEGADSASGGEPAAEAAPSPPPPKPSPKPVVAMRGDDRPGMKKTEPVPPGRGGKFGDRKGGPGGRMGERRDDRAPRGDARTGAPGRFADRDFEDRGPRLGDVAFRAQREAMEHAQLALKKLAAQAHGEALTQLLTAWEQRSAEQVPSSQELGKSVTAAVRAAWVKALSSSPAADASEALLRLEIAADVPTPAEQLSARRMLQLQLLTRRNEAAPAESWGQDAARVLASPYEAGAARRLQNALRNLLRR
jgi:hypothetical protein